MSTSMSLSGALLAYFLDCVIGYLRLILLPWSKVVGFGSIVSGALTIMPGPSLEIELPTEPGPSSKYCKAA